MITISATNARPPSPSAVLFTLLSLPTSSSSCSVRPVLAPSTLAADLPRSGETPGWRDVLGPVDPHALASRAQFLGMPLAQLTSSTHHNTFMPSSCPQSGNAQDLEVRHHACLYLQNPDNHLF